MAINEKNKKNLIHKFRHECLQFLSKKKLQGTKNTKNFMNCLSTFILRQHPIVLFALSVIVLSSSQWISYFTLAIACSSHL